MTLWCHRLIIWQVATDITFKISTPPPKLTKCFLFIWGCLPLSCKIKMSIGSVLFSWIWNEHGRWNIQSISLCSHHGTNSKLHFPSNFYSPIQVFWIKTKSNINSIQKREVHKENVSFEIKKKNHWIFFVYMLLFMATSNHKANLQIFFVSSQNNSPVFRV